MIDLTERMGQPYFQCSDCAYATFNRDYADAHVRDHIPHPTLDEVMAAAAAPESASEPEPEPTPEPAPKRSAPRSRKQKR